MKRFALVSLGALIVSLSSGCCGGPWFGGYRGWPSMGGCSSGGCSSGGCGTGAPMYQGAMMAPNYAPVAYGVPMNYGGGGAGCGCGY